MNPLLKPDFFKKEKNKIFLKRGIKFFVVLIFYNNLQYKSYFCYNGNLIEKWSLQHCFYC